MREILFRGKRTDNGEWVVGHLLKYEDGRARINESHTDIFCYEKDRSIIQTVAYEVKPETVGQYTGLTDKNGKKIFEGDIVRIVSTDYMGFDEIGKVDFKDGCFGVSYFPLWERKYDFGHWHFHRIGQIDKWQDMCASGEVKYTYEVIGNIHDNPELIGGGESEIG